MQRRFGWVGLLVGWALVSPPSPVWAAPPASATTQGTEAAAPPASVLPFIEDDFAKARHVALAKHKLLVVDAWALWCHTCLSMRSFVFPDPVLSPLRDQFVYAAIDTELPQNEAFVAAFPVGSLPTMLVIEPRASGDDVVVARFAGAMTANELRARLLPLSSLRSPDRTTQLLSAADAKAARADWAAALPLYVQAASQPAVKPDQRAVARLGQIQALRSTHQFEACAALMASAAAEVGNGATAADFFSYGVDCVPRAAGPHRVARVTLARQHLQALLDAPDAQLSSDDRSDVLSNLGTLAEQVGDQPAARAYTEQRLALLEAAVARAQNPVAKATYDAHRVECYMRLGQDAKAEALLRATQALLPTDYNPPARLARLYAERGRRAEAVVQLDRALALASGPRRIGMYELKARVLEESGFRDQALTALEAALSLLQTTPRPDPARVRALTQRISLLRNPKAPAPLRPGTVPIG